MKRLTVLTVLLLLALVVTACGPKATPTPAPAPTAAPQAAEPTKAPEPAKAAEPTMAAGCGCGDGIRWRECGRRGLQEPDLSGGCLQRQDEGHEGQHGRPVHRRRRREVRQLDQGLRGCNRYRHPIPGLEGVRGVDHDADAGRHGLGHHRLSAARAVGHLLQAGQGCACHQAGAGDLVEGELQAVVA